MLLKNCLWHRSLASTTIFKRQSSDTSPVMSIINPPSFTFSICPNQNYDTRWFFSLPLRTLHEFLARCWDLFGGWARPLQGSFATVYLLQVSSLLLYEKVSLGVVDCTFIESSTVNSSNRQQWIYRIVDSGKTNCWQYIRRIVDSVFIELLPVYSSNIVKPHQNNSLGIWCQISKCSISWLFNGNQWFWRLVAFVSQTGGQLHKDTFLTKAFPHKENFHRAAAIAQWNCQGQPPWGRPGFKSKAQHLRIFNLYR